MRIMHPIARTVLQTLITSPIFLAASQIILFVSNCHFIMENLKSQIQIQDCVISSKTDFAEIKCAYFLYSSPLEPDEHFFPCLEGFTTFVLTMILSQRPEEAGGGLRALPGVHVGRGGGRRPLKLPRHRH